MSNAQWPASLPQRVEQQDFTARPRPNVIRTDMEVGPVKTRRRATRSVEEMTVSVALDREQYDTFTAFWTDTIKDGSLPFDWQDPRTGEAATFLPMDEYRESADGPYMRVQLALEKQI